MTGLIVSALAAYRLIRAWFWEEIGEKPRIALEDWASKPVMRGDEVLLRPTYAKGWLYKLVTCPYCSGFWVTLGVVIASRRPVSRRVIEALAASMIVAVALDHYPDMGREAADENDEDEVSDEPVTEHVADVVDLANRRDDS